MLKVGLTGGIGAGKSEVARRLAANGAVIVDSDRLAREVVEPGTDGLAEVVTAFGAEVLTAGGELDRPALGAKVFGDDVARRRLEGIIHPRVRARAAELAHAAPPDAILVNDVPLLVETGQAPSYHLVLVVDAQRDLRIRRLAETRGMAAEQASARIAAQASDDQRRAAADVLIDNNGSRDDLHARVDELWRERLRPFGDNLLTGASAPVSRLVHIVPPDPTWPEQAARLVARIGHAAGGAAVSHIGSTSVPGLPAKDIIDLMLAVPTLDAADALNGRLAAAGFPRRPGEWVDNSRGTPGETWPKRLHGTADPGRQIHLHVRVTGSPGWRFALLMRDHLRAVPAARDGYAAEKTRLARENADRWVYSEAKEPWFDAEARAADDWAEATGWVPGERVRETK